MALLFCDSFDHYSVDMSSRKWTTGGLVGTMNAIDAANGRTNNGANIGTFGNPSLTLGNEYLTLACGVAYKYGEAYGNDPIQFGSDVGLSASFGDNGDGRFFFRCGGGQNPPAPTVLNVLTWYYLELYCTVAISGSSGSYTATYTGQIRVNEAVIDSGSFTQTLSGSYTSGRGFSRVGLTGPGSSFNASVDDVYITDGELLGDIRIYCLFPRADGSLSQWVPSTPGAHYSMVLEHVPDDLTTYVSCDSSSLGNEDDYYLDSITGFVGTVKGAQGIWCVSKSDAGAATVEGIWKSSGSSVLTPGVNPSYGAWRYFLSPQRKSLFTGSDWTAAEINALQLGIQRTF